MDDKPIFSIIIPSYNCAQQLKKALDSLIDQSFKDFEVIVCDSSSDDTKQLVDSYCDKLNIKYFWEASFTSPAGPRNSGLRIAYGEFIAFLDADDWWYPDKLECVKKYLNNADIIYHDLDIYSEKGKERFRKIKGRCFKKPVFIDLMINSNPIFTSSVVVKKIIIDRVGGFSIEDTLEDFDLWLRISRITDNFLYIPNSLGAYWLGEKNRSSRSEKMINRLKEVYQTYLDYLKKEDRKESEAVLSYLLARCKQKIGSEKEALALFKKSVISKNIKFKLRSLIWILFIYFKLLCQKN